MYNPNQPRVPAGRPTGGQFAFSGSLLSVIAPITVEVDDAKYAYHATSEESLADIARGALKTHRASFGTDQGSWPDGSTEKRAYFGKASSVWQFAPEHGKPVALRVVRSQVELRMESGTGDFFSRKPVSASKLDVLTSKGWEPLVMKSRKT